MSSARISKLSYTFLGAGFIFLYVPMLILVIYSFNDSRLVTVWAGFSVKWYGELFRDQQMIDAAWLSLRIALATATTSMVLGTMAGLVLARFPRFAGRTSFTGMITAPLVMPEIITGLSLLLLFVSMGEWLGWPQQRGMSTIWIAHVTFTMAFVAVVISARLREMDRSLEEAAMDLGANRVKTFFTITLPIIVPALLAGWLLAFTLSVDDLVVASFVSGPSATTLPMVVFSSVRLGLSPKINALASLLIGLVSIGAVVGWWVLWRDERRRMRDIQQAFADHS